jgi:hypothetical protein
MANLERGELAITLAGVPIVLRPTYTSFAEIEQVLGDSLVVIAQRVMSSSHSLRDTVVIIASGAKAAGNNLPSAKVGELVVKEGMLHCSAYLMSFLNNALTGGETASPGEAEAAPDQA